MFILEFSVIYSPLVLNEMKLAKKNIYAIKPEGISAMYFKAPSH